MFKLAGCCDLYISLASHALGKLWSASRETAWPLWRSSVYRLACGPRPRAPPLHAFEPHCRTDWMSRPVCTDVEWLATSRSLFSSCIWGSNDLASFDIDVGPTFPCSLRAAAPILSRFALVA